MFGKAVSDLQSDVQISDTGFTGTLKYVTDYTGFSSDPELQNGNFLALKFTAESGATIQAGLQPSRGSGLVTLDEDMNGVWRIADPITQKFKVVKTKDGHVDSRLYSLADLVCEQPEVQE